MNHWARFPAWRPLARQAKKPDFTYRDFAQRDHIFMRWKEYFLVPDHRVRTISGASFEGFYYICFNQIEGTVTGIYFHAKSEKCVATLALCVRFLLTRFLQVPAAGAQACRGPRLHSSSRVSLIRHRGTPSLL